MTPSRTRELARQARGLALRWLARVSSRRVGVVLVHHGVAAENGDRRTEIVPPIGRAALQQQVRHLARGYAIVPPSALQRAAAARRRGGRIPVALTFDDDLASHLTEAAPILRRAGAVAGFFVSGASLDEPGTFWWEDLQRALDRGLLAPGDLDGLPEEVVAAALDGTDRGPARLAEAIEELTPDARAALAAVLRERAGAPPPDAGIRRTALASLAADGHEIGFHTLRHDRMPPLDDPRLAAALEDGRQEVESAAGAPLTTISYPHGRADERVARAAEAHGFGTGFAGGGTVVTPEDDRLLLPRVTPVVESPGAFAVQMARLASGRLAG